MTQPHDPTPGETDPLERSILNAIAAASAVSLLARTLSERPAVGGDELGELLMERERSFTELGRQVIEALHQGDEVTITDGGALAAVTGGNQASTHEARAPTPPVAPAPARGAAPEVELPQPKPPEQMQVAQQEPKAESPSQQQQLEPQRVEAPSVPVDHTPSVDHTPADPSSLLALQQGINEPSWQHAATRPRRDLGALAAAWGPPTLPDDSPLAPKKLRDAMRHLDGLLALPRTEQRLILAYAVPRARQVQTSQPNELLARVFQGLSQWSHQHEPGYVHGMARAHGPEHGSWRADALLAWHSIVPRVPAPRTPRASATMADLAHHLEGAPQPKELVRLALALLDAKGVDQDHLVQLLGPHMPLLRGDRRLKKLRKRIAHAAKKHTQRDGSVEPSLAELGEWPWLSYTLGKRGVMLGGDKRNKAKERTQHQFGLASLRWETGWNPRQVQSLADRVRAGSVDIVFLLRRFIKHSTTEVLVPACKEQGVPFVPVPSGYGLSSIQAAIEQHLQQPTASGSDNPSPPHSLESP